MDTAFDPNKLQLPSQQACRAASVLVSIKPLHSAAVFIDSFDRVPQTRLLLQKTVCSSL
jgi:hypothetical protein